MIKICGIKEKLDPIKKELSDIINKSMVEAFQFPENKRAYRFFPMNTENFYFPEGRTDSYTVIEISMIESRSMDARKKLIHTLFKNIESQLKINPVDVEITISESPACNWGFRGVTGDEAKFDYKINV